MRIVAYPIIVETEEGYYGKVKSIKIAGGKDADDSWLMDEIYKNLIPRLECSLVLQEQQQIHMKS